MNSRYSITTAEGAAGVAQSGAGERVFAALVVIAVACAGLWRVRYGISVTDEGMYLSAANRYLLGDLPFRDEIMNPIRSFDILLSLVMRAIPGGGSVLAMRYVGLAFHLACVGALVASMKKFLPVAARAAAFAMVAYVNVFSIWTPGYHMMEADFMCLCLALSMAGITADSAKKSAACGALAGAVHVGGAVCYAPLSALAVVPALYAFYEFARRRIKSEAFIFCAAYIATFAAGAAAIVAVDMKSGAYENLSQAAAMFASVSAYSIPAVKKAELFFSNMPTRMLFFHAIYLVLFINLAICAGYEERWKKALAYGALAVVLYRYASIPARVASLTEFVEPLFVLSSAAYLLATAGRRFRDENEKTALSFLFAFGVLWHCAVGIVSTTKYAGASYTTPSFLLLLAVVVYRELRRAYEIRGAVGGETRAGLLTAALCAALAINIFAPSFVHTYLDDTMNNLNTPFTKGKLRGIYSTRQRVENIESLLNQLEPLVKRGDYLLAYDDLPLLYYLTDTRPAINTVWSTKKWPLEIREKSVEYMIANNRAPEYAVRLKVNPCDIGVRMKEEPGAARNWWKRLTKPKQIQRPPEKRPISYYSDPAKDPVNYFIESKYALYDEVGDFEIWRRK